MEKAVIGLDIGTSSAKAMLYGEHSGIILEASVPIEKDEKSLSAPKLLSDITHLLSEVSAGVTNCKIVSVGLSTMFPTLLAVGKNGKPLTRLMLWKDDRAGHILDRKISHPSHSRELHKRTGCVAHESYSLWKIRWLKEHRPEVFERAEKFISLQEYLTHALTEKYITSKSVASTSGMLNAKTLDWDKYALSLAGIPREKLSPLASAFHTEQITNEAAEETGLPRKTLIALGTGDGLAAHIGSGCMREGRMSMSMGTTSAIRLASNRTVPKNSFIWSYYLSNGKRIMGSAINAGGSSFEWLRKNFHNGKELPYAALDSAASELPAAGPIFLPFHDGERGPEYKRGMKERFSSVKDDDDTASLYRSVAEGITFNLYSCYLLLEKEGGVPKEIRASGGYSNSDFLMQMQSDIFNQQISVPHVKEASSLGAALIAMKPAGLIRDFSSAKIPVEKAYSPRKGMHETYLKRFALYRRLYRTL